MHMNERRAAMLLPASMLAALLLHPNAASAQSADQLQAIQSQIKSLEAEIRQMKLQMTKRDAALRQAQVEASEARTQARFAAAHTQQLELSVAHTPPPTVVYAAPPPAAPAAPVLPPLPTGSFRVGAVTVTLGGFAAAEGVFRSRNEAASIDTNFNTGIPLPNSPNYHIPEYRETAQQSRFSILTQAQLSDSQKLTGYLETDFLSAGDSSNSTQSNSYTLRLRQFWGEYDNSDWGLHFIGGQAWSLATMYSKGLLPRSENVPLTIDAQYVVGFNWERQAQFRIVKDFDQQKYWLGFSAEEPQTTYSGNAGPNCLTGAPAPTAIGGSDLEYTACGGSNVNSIQAYSDNTAPDLIAKFAADPGFGHFEVYGILSFLGGRVSDPTSGTGTNYNTTGEGIGAGMILPLIKKRLNFQVSGLIGDGVGRYGTAQLPDATFSPTGKIEPLPDYSIMGGFVAHATPKLDVYTYGGAEGVQAKYYTDGSVNSGYGNPNVSLTGCEVELGTCNANTSAVVEGTIGAWYRFLKGSYGTLEFGTQYEYIERNTFAGVGATKGSTISPSTNENAVLISFRYLPFN
jgi:hypothetical protein